MRDAIVRRHGRCMICGHSPRRPWADKPRECSQLCCHEIANGPFRQKALDKPFAILVLCWWCNGEVVTDKRRWPESRQLSLLRDKAPRDYDLAAYNALIGRGPDRITQEEVDAWTNRHNGSGLCISVRGQPLLALRRSCPMTFRPARAGCVDPRDRETGEAQHAKSQE